MSITVFVKGKSLPSKEDVEEAIKKLGFDFKFSQNFETFENLNLSDSIDCAYMGQDTFVEIYISSKDEMLEQSNIHEHSLFGYHKAITFTYGSNELVANCVYLITLGLMKTSDTRVYYELSSIVSFDELIQGLINEDDSILFDTSLYHKMDYNSSWTDNSVLVENITIDSYYSLSNSIYVGDSNDINEMKDKNKYASLKLPSFYETLKDYKKIYFLRMKMIPSENLTGKEVELAAYYKSLIRIAQRYRKKPVEITQYFSQKLWIKTGDTILSFPWYDWQDEISRFFKQFDSSRRGLLFQDSDQGWSIDVYADDNYYYVCQRGGEWEEIIVTNIKFKKNELRSAIGELEKRLLVQKELLTNSIGVDLWSNERNFNEDLYQLKDSFYKRLWGAFLTINGWVFYALLISIFLVYIRFELHWSIALIVAILMIVRSFGDQKKSTLSK